MAPGRPSRLSSSGGGSGPLVVLVHTKSGGGKRARDALPPSTWPFLPAFKLVLAVAVVVVLVVNRLVLVRRPGLGNLDFYFILHAHLSRDQRLHYDTMGWFLK